MTAGLSSCGRESWTCSAFGLAETRTLPQSTTVGVILNVLEHSNVVLYKDSASAPAAFLTMGPEVAPPRLHPRRGKKRGLPLAVVSSHKSRWLWGCSWHQRDSHPRPASPSAGFPQSPVSSLAKDMDGGPSHSSVSCSPRTPMKSGDGEDFPSLQVPLPPDSQHLTTFFFFFFPPDR